MADMEPKSEDWRSRVPAKDLEHWERVWSQWQKTDRQATADGVAYRYHPWSDVRGRRSFVGKVASVAYWTKGFGELPWGHQHAHTYAFAFKEITDIGSDWVIFKGENSTPLISYDTICVQERL